MSLSIEMSLPVPKPLHEQMERLAHSLNIPAEQLVIRAIENYVQSFQHQPDADSNENGARSASTVRHINQGDVYWLQLDGGSISHPHVVVQEDVLNHSRIHTVVVCALTSNLKRTSLPGNVLIDAGEANLPKPSVVEASKVSSVEKTQLGDYIGTLSTQRVQQILAGMRFLQRSFGEGGG